MISRHGILAAGAAVVILAGTASAQDLTISVWGGSYAEEFRETVVEPFEKEYGVKVTLETGLSGERLAKVMATGGRGTDLVYFTDYQMAEIAARDLLQPVDPEAISNLDDIRDFARDPLGNGLCPAFTVLGVGLAYNKDMTQEPSSWSDLFREGIGRRGFPDINISYGPLLVAMAAQMGGGGLDNMDPGFEKIAAFKDRLQIFTGREILDAINQGDVAISPHLNIFVQRDESVPLRFTFPEEGGLGVLNLVCVTAQSDNVDLAQKFIDFHLSQAVQQEMLVNQGEGTVRSNVDIPEQSKFSLISKEDLEKLQFFDVGTIVKKRAEWIDRWQEEVIAR